MTVSLLYDTSAGGFGFAAKSFGFFAPRMAEAGIGANADRSITCMRNEPSRDFARDSREASNPIRATFLARPAGCSAFARLIIVQSRRSAVGSREPLQSSDHEILRRDSPGR